MVFKNSPETVQTTEVLELCWTFFTNPQASWNEEMQVYQPFKTQKSFLWEATEQRSVEQLNTRVLLEASLW